MTDTNDKPNRTFLQKIAHRVMLEKGLLPDFPKDVLDALKAMQDHATPSDSSIRDLRDLLWCSIRKSRWALWVGR